MLQAIDEQFANDVITDEQELHIEKLLAAAVGKYSHHHVDMELQEIEDSSVLARRPLLYSR